MGNSKFVQFGPWIPFHRPLPIPTVDPFEAPLQSICVNEEWTEYINGALKTLTREQSWNSSDQAALIQVRSDANKVISSWSDGCGQTAMDWHISPESGLETSWQYYGNQPDGTPILFYTGWGQPNHDWRGLTVVGSVPAGGKVISFDLKQPGGSGLQVTVTNCLDETSIFTTGSEEVTFADIAGAATFFQMKRMLVAAVDTDPMFFHFFAVGPYDCVQA